MTKPDILLELALKSKELVMNLVAEAGVDVSDWPNYKGGKTNPAANPKYCYEWAFIEEGKVVVLNLWYEDIEYKDDLIFRNINMRDLARKLGKLPNKSIWVKRARSMDEAMKTAYQNILPVRVILCDGDKRKVKKEESEAAKVAKRSLDTETWTITKYNLETGDCTITRGTQEIKYVDQFVENEGKRLINPMVVQQSYI